MFTISWMDHHSSGLLSYSVLVGIKRTVDPEEKDTLFFDGVFIGKTGVLGNTPYDCGAQ